MKAWSVVATPEEIAQARSDAAFAELLTLGRVANQIRAVLAGGFALKEQDGTAAARDRNAFFLLLTGMLAEAIPALERSGKHFRDLAQWQGTVLPILQSPSVQRFRNDFLLPLRNQAVFHNDANVSQLGLSSFHPPEDQALVRGSTDEFMDVYYPMSDMVAVVFIADSAGADERTLEWLATALTSSIELGKSICMAIDAVVGQALDERGFTWDEHDAPGG